MVFEDIILDKEILELKDYVVNIRRDLHENPEPSLKEYETSKYIKNELKKIGLSYEEIGETGILTEIKGEKSKSYKTILLRADIDALELFDKKDVDYVSKNKGLCHACGHDGHTASLLLATKILNSKKDEFSGNIKIIFQQAEEIGAGARIFVREKVLDDVDFAFGIHLNSQMPLGQIGINKKEVNASCDIFKIKVKGKSAHAATPEQGNDSALAVASILLEIQSIISRQKNPQDIALISIGKISAGTKYNIIASSGELEGTLRCFNKKNRKDLLEKIEHIAKLSAEIHNCKVEFSNYDAASPLVNDEISAEFVENIAKDIVGKENIIENKPSLGAEDFADYLEVTKGCFVYVGSASSEKTNFPHHSEYFDIDERSLLISAILHINVALKYLN